MSQLNVIADSLGRDDVFPVSAELIKRAFRICGKEFLFTLEELRIDEGGDKVIWARVGVQVGGWRTGNRQSMSDFCLFDDIQDWEKSKEQVYAAESGEAQFRRGLNFPTEL